MIAGGVTSEKCESNSTESSAFHGPLTMSEQWDVHRKFRNYSMFLLCLLLYLIFVIKNSKSKLTSFSSVSWHICKKHVVFGFLLVKYSQLSTRLCSAYNMFPLNKCPFCYKMLHQSLLKSDSRSQKNNNSHAHIEFFKCQQTLVWSLAKSYKIDGAIAEFSF